MKTRNKCTIVKNITIIVLLVIIMCGFIYSASAKNTKTSRNYEQALKELKQNKDAMLISHEWHTITKCTFELETKRKGSTEGYKLGKRWSKRAKKFLPQYYKRILVVK